jgi:branched-chain amino acid transport system substrate-binding protein
VLHIGLLLPSDDLEHLAPAMQAAAELAVEDLNAAGGVLGSPVELLIEDSGGGNGEGVHAAFDALVAAGADLMVGPVDPAGIAVAKDLAAEQGLAGCSAHDTKIDSLFDDDGRFVRTIPSEELLAAAITTAITDDGYNTVNMVTPPEAADLRDALVGHLEDAGVTVEKNREIDPSSFDPAEVVSDLNDSGALAAILVGAD